MAVIAKVLLFAYAKFCYGLGVNSFQTWGFDLSCPWLCLWIEATFNPKNSFKKPPKYQGVKEHTKKCIALIFTRRQRLDSWSAPRHHSIMKRLLNKIGTQHLRLEFTNFYILKLNSQALLILSGVILINFCSRTHELWVIWRKVKKYWNAISPLRIG